MFGVSLLGNPATHFSGFPTMVVYEGKEQSQLRADGPRMPSLIASYENLLLPQGSP